MKEHAGCKRAAKKLRSSPLFGDLSEAQIEQCLSESQALCQKLERGEILFEQAEPPSALFLLVEGRVGVCKDAVSGKRLIITDISRPGELFGEVYLFLKRQPYDYYGVALEPSVVMALPKDFMTGQKSSLHPHLQTILMRNMLMILASKAYYLNQRLQVLLSHSLRQKIVKVLLSQQEDGGRGKLRMSREEMADFLGAARPSLSRELMKMQSEGLIRIQGKKFEIVNPEKIEEYL